MNMKILVISHAAVQKGYQKKFVEIAKYPNIEITILLPEYWIENYRYVKTYIESKANIQYVIGKSVWKGFGSRYFFITKLWMLVKNIKPDIIHIEQEPWSLAALQIVLYRNLISPKSKIIFRTSRSFNVKLKFPFLLKIIEKYVYKYSEFAFPLNLDAVKFLRLRGYKKGLQVCPNGVDTDIFYPKIFKKHIKLPIEKNKFNIGYIGRFIEAKGIKYLIEAVSNIKKDCKLILIGDGPNKKELKRQANYYKIEDRIKFVETIKLEEVPEYLNCLDVLVLPSYKTDEWEEFFGRVLVEAMACKVPVIGSDSGEIPNVIKDAGLIFPSHNSTELKKCILKVISNEEVRKEMVEKGYTRVQENYSWKAIAKLTVEVYYKLQNL